MCNTDTNIFKNIHWQFQGSQSQDLSQKSNDCAVDGHAISLYGIDITITFL